MTPQPTQLPVTIIIACILLAGSAFLASFFLLQAIFATDDHRLRVWHREQARWNRLSQGSGLFRSLQHWIVGLSQVIETRLPWFVEMPVTQGRFKRFAITITRLLIGDSNKLSQATRVGNAIEPWATSEVVATGFLFAGFAGCAVGLTQLLTLVSLSAMAKVLVAFLVVYRLWCYRIISRSAARQRQVRQFLPHAMDSIAMVMSSGGTFRFGIDTVIRDFPDHPLSVELIRLRNDLQRGQTMSQALQVTKDSIGLPEFDELVRVLSTIHQHGAPGAENFVGLAKQLRISHLRHMEDEVGRAEAMMSLPTMLVMGSCMLVACAPFVLSILSSNLFE
ncbi:type II secretion system F family protein [Novipirellula sp. SH528]|uniref:type II secretion system F family protein n=1 Tax=Novipirellula sp. SH528 TaxID=3454466 RepID=UPI003F9F48AA